MTEQSNKKLYQVVYAGELQPGAELASVKVELAKMFKADDAQIDRFFSGNRVVVKSGVDAATAKKYRAAFEQVGARCRIGECSIQNNMASPSETVSSAPAPTAPAIRMAPVGARLAPQAKVHSPPDLDLDHLNVMPVGSRISDEDNTEKPTPPVVDHITVAAVGERLEEEREEVDLGDSLNLDHISIAPEGTPLIDQQDTIELDESLDLDHLSIAPVGTRLEDERDDAAVKIPDISHMSVVALDAESDENKE